MNNNATNQNVQEEIIETKKKTHAVYGQEKRKSDKVAKKAAAAKQDALKQKRNLRDKTHTNEEFLMQKANEIKNSLTAHTWRDLEVNRKFDHDKKLTFIKDDMLIVGCDIGSEMHFFRAIDSKGIELGKKPVAFPNSEEGYQGAIQWAIDLAARNDKTQIILGLEPTGHYWFTIASWMVANGISVVQVNPYAVRCSKEVGDNSQMKDDRKDPKVIAELVKNGNYGMPYLPEGVYAEIRGLSGYRNQLMEDRIRSINRLHREMKIYFPEYKSVVGKFEGAFSLRLLEAASMPEDILALGEAGIKAIWKAAKLKGCGYNKAKSILLAASNSVGLKEGQVAGRMAIKRFASQIISLSSEIDRTEELLREKCLEIPHAKNLLEIRGIGNDILAGILGELGDINRFDSTKEIQKLSGLALVANNSGKHQGQVKISKRGRKKLRYWLYQGALSVIAQSQEFREIHEYYTTRQQNPLKKIQSLIVIGCKLLRVICTMLKKGTKYDPVKLKQDILRPAVEVAKPA